MSNRPNIFVIGTMKGGTTALHRILTSHPTIFPARKKEVHYFSLHYDRGEDWYHEQFSEQPSGMNYIDASPTYLDVANTMLIPRLIDKYSPNGKLIFIGRNPIERAISHFYHLRKVNKIPALQDMDCNTFFAHDLARMLPGSGPIASYFMLAINFSLFHARVNRYKAFFGDRLLVLDNSQLRNKPQETAKRVFEHVGVDPIWDESFAVIRHSHRTKLADVSPEVFQRLSHIMRRDYEMFCKRYGIDFIWPEPDA